MNPSYGNQGSSIPGAQQSPATNQGIPAMPQQGKQVQPMPRMQQPSQMAGQPQPGMEPQPEPHQEDPQEEEVRSQRAQLEKALEQKNLAKGMKQEELDKIGTE